MHMATQIGTSNMLIKFKRIGFSLVLLAALAGCEGGTGYKKFVGGLTGAAAGGYAGAQFGKGQGKLATTAIGTVLGFIGGYKIGNDLDDKDTLEASLAMERALNQNRAVAWRNDLNHGVVKPVRTVRQRNRRICRDFHHHGTIDGQPTQAVGRACQQRDKSWKIVAS